MSDLKAAAQQALEAMRCAVPTGKITLYAWDKAMAALRAALAEPQANTLHGWVFKRNEDGTVGIFAPPPRPGESQRTSDCIGPGQRDLHELLGKLADHMAALAEPVQDERTTIADLRCAKWLDPECAEKGACQSLKFKRSAQPVQDSEWEVRADGKRVRKDRWQIGIRRIVALLWGNRQEFEVDEVVEAVRHLVPNPYAEGDDEALVKAALAEPVQEPGFWGRVAARQASRIKQLEATAQQALEALENCGGLTKDDAVQRVAAIIALKDVLAEPVQVPAKFLDIVTYTGTGVNCAGQALPAPDRSICPACGGMASDPIVPQRLRQRRNKSTT